MPLTEIAVAVEPLATPAVTLQFRDAVPADIPVLAPLYRQLVAEAKYDQGAMEAALADIMASDHQEIIVAELDGRIVGTSQLIIYENLIRAPRRKAIIDSVVVAEDVRGHGIGSAMIGHAIAKLKARGCSHIGVSTAFHRVVAHHLYEKMHFDRFGYHYLLVDKQG